jgi:ergothioneine biosynthesis protein EgtB
MTRPSVSEVYQYRAYVNEQMEALFNQELSEKELHIIETGINHEEQHQELFIYDIKYILGNQPTFPVYGTGFNTRAVTTPEAFHQIPEGIYPIGHADSSFCFDNELGVHKVYLPDFSISANPVTNAEYLEFMADGGYENFNLWHDEGWHWIRQNHIQAPMYWHKIEDIWHYYDLDGLKPAEPNHPVKHISFYEAFAFAEWKGMRLPTEFEWETAATLFEWGQLWEWTNSAYLPYPGFSKAPGALGEYNGKFMVNQMVLRGASVATPTNHSRRTYRNFFSTNMRWQYNGIRLAK